MSVEFVNEGENDQVNDNLLNGEVEDTDDDDGQ